MKINDKYEGTAHKPSEPAVVPKYKFSDLVDISVFGQFLENLYKVAQIPSAIIDMEGKILTGAGWQRICTDFHRKHPNAEKICIKSDTHIWKEIDAGRPYVVYECPHGLVDSSCPIIIEGQHLANVFTGQMLHEPLTDKTIEHFRNQAIQYGFNEREYLDALAEVPVFSKDKHKDILELLSKLAEEIAKTGLANLKLLEQSKIDHKNIQRFRIVMDSIDAFVYVADINTHEVLFVNQYGTDLLGGENITGKLCWQNIQKDQTGPCDFCTNKYIVDDKGKPTETYKYEFKNTLTDKWFSISDRAIEWVDGRIVRLEIATDITDRKQSEQGKALFEAQLLQVQKMEAVGTMAGGIAHDFNNILGIILGNADLALKYIAKENPASQNIESILQASKRAQAIVKQLLSFSRSEKGHRKPFYFCRLIEECMNTIRTAIPSSVKLSIDVPVNCKENINKCLMVNVDPNQIYQILMNLCINAVQAMNEKGNLEIIIKEVIIDNKASQLGLTPGTYECLSISDTGPGISDDIIGKVFDPFFTTKDVGNGTGLGLSVVHGIVEEHAGKIFLNTEPGFGTTVNIYLPAIKGEPEAEFRDIDTLPRGTERILIVDDEKDLLDVECRMLQDLGYTVIAKTSPTEALIDFRSQPKSFDVVILDQTMPEMTGIELANEISKIRPQVPIILCTGYSNLVTEEMAIKAGIKEFHIKPFEKKKLAQLVREVLKSDLTKSNE